MSGWSVRVAGLGRERLEADSITRCQACGHVNHHTAAGVALACLVALPSEPFVIHCNRCEAPVLKVYDTGETILVPVGDRP